MQRTAIVSGLPVDESRKHSTLLIEGGMWESQPVFVERIGRRVSELLDERESDLRVVTIQIILED